MAEERKHTGDLCDALTVAAQALDDCSDLFGDIRADWSDPRFECREGQRIVDEALSVVRAAIKRATEG